jgi:FMN-dependent NADH-azoreductase
MVTSMKLLHIDTSIMGANSVSRQIAAAAVDRLRQTTPGLDVIYRDLAAAPLPHVELSHLPGDHPLSAMAAKADAAAAIASQAALDEFLDADIVVIGAPMYNFTIPTQLKAWIDRILVPGKTFQYGANGVEGLAKGKRVIIAISRGGFYGADTPTAAAEHVETYLRTVFGFIGVAPEILLAEGVQAGADHRQTAVDSALKHVAALAA